MHENAPHVLRPATEPPPAETSKPAVVPSRSKAPPPVAAAPTDGTVTTVAPDTSTPAPEPSASAAQATADDDSTPWGWILLALAVAAAIVAIAMLLHRRNLRRQLEVWRQQTRGAVDAAFVCESFFDGLAEDDADIFYGVV